MGEIEYQTALLLQYRLDQEKADEALARSLQQQFEKENPSRSILVNPQKIDLDETLARLLQEQFQQDNPADTKLITKDEHLARSLQEQFEHEANSEKPSSLTYKVNKATLNSSKSLTDPSWELVDPTPEIHTLFVAFSAKFFWDKLQSVCVSWSKKMTSCAGVCSYHGRGGMCAITLSEPLLKLRPRKDLVETLLHEMIHAYLFVTHNNKDRDGHGPEFHKHMDRINKESGTKITVYHSFHDEVRLYQQHWWRCDGPCQKRKPFYGMVRRANNRAPGPNDRWWPEHSRTCNGTFIKVKEPEKTEKANKKTAPKKITNNGSDIRNFIPVVKDKSGGSTVSTSSVAGTTASTSNIIGFKDLNNRTKEVLPKNDLNGTGTKKRNPIASTSTSTSTTSSNITGFKDLNSKIKGRSNSVSTIVLNKTTATKTESDFKVDIFNKTNPKTERPSSTSTSSDFLEVRNHWANKFGSSSTISNPKKRHSHPDSDIEEISPKIPKPSRDSTQCPICNRKVPVEELNEHLDQCLLELDAAPRIVVVPDSPVKEMKECPICYNSAEISVFDRHVEQCLLKIYDKMEDEGNSFSDDENKENEDEVVSCLSCGKMICKSQLQNHLDECMSGIFTEENEPVDESLEYQYNCPFCLKLVKDKDMKCHIDECLNVADNPVVNSLINDDF